MTIIVASKSERLMAADTLVVDADTRVGTVAKIVKCKDGSVAGAAGDSSSCMEFLVWCKRGRTGKPKRRWFKHTIGMVLTKRGDILIYEGPVPDKMLDDFQAIGCGSTIAKGRRTAGASALECVQAAIELSLFCGGKIDAIRLD